jgi:predicted nucleic acid-binding protein
VRLVVDASVALKWYLAVDPGEFDVAQAIAIAELAEPRTIEIFAPVHWALEVVDVLSRKRPELVPDAIIEIADLTARTIASPEVLERGAELSSRLNHHLFDTLYHAVALEVGATLVTADEGYYAKAQHLGHIQRLADFPVGTPIAP